MKHKKYFSLLLSAVIFLSFVISVSAHPGRTDSNGGHYNRKTGEYHYHNGSSAGRNTGGSSSDYTYSYFAGPTTDYSSDSNNTQSTQEDTSKKEKAINTLQLDGIIIAVIFVVALLYCFISKSKKKKAETTITSAPLSEEELQETLNKFLPEHRKRLYEACEKQNEPPKKRFEQIAGFPDGFYIDGFTINDVKSTEPYGRATAYITNRDKTLHFFQYCSGAARPINMLFDTYEMKNFNLCEKCKKSEKYNFYLNYESWYKQYIKMKIADDNDDENI